MAWYQRISVRTYILFGAALITIHAVALFFMGQTPLCECGYIKLWHGITYSSENSQHISDWYTFSHIIHGFAFYWILRRIRPRWPVGLLFVLALLAESAWELFENTDFIIHRYREVTISLDYYGDSIINSAGDVLATALGFFLARRLPVRITILLLVAMELFVGYWIRDNLTFNIIMLLYPFEAIKIWQMGS